MKIVVLPHASPKPPKTVAREFTRVVAETQIQMAMIANEIPDSVGNDLSRRPTRKIVIESFESLLAIDASVAIEKSQVFFLFGINSEYGISRGFVGLPKVGNMLKLLVTLGNGSSRKAILGLPIMKRLYFAITKAKRILANANQIDTNLPPGSQLTSI